MKKFSVVKTEVFGRNRIVSIVKTFLIQKQAENYITELNDFVITSLGKTRTMAFYSLLEYDDDFR